MQLFCISTLFTSARDCQGSFFYTVIDSRDRATLASRSLPVTVDGEKTEPLWQQRVEESQWPISSHPPHARFSHGTGPQFEHALPPPLEESDPFSSLPPRHEQRRRHHLRSYHHQLTLDSPASIHSSLFPWVHNLPGRHDSCPLSEPSTFNLVSYVQFDCHLPPSQRFLPRLRLAHISPPILTRRPRP